MVSRITCLTIASAIVLTMASGAFAFERGGVKLKGKIAEQTERSSGRDDYRPNLGRRAEGSGPAGTSKRDEDPGYGGASMRDEDKKDGKPDLVPSGFKVDKVTYANKKNECEFSIRTRVKNIGTAKAGRSKLNMKIDNAIAKTKDVGSLKEGKTSSKKTITGKVVGLGRHKITVVADAKGTVDELKEGNNSETETIQCKKKGKG